jgi:hypothetical protein
MRQGQQSRRGRNRGGGGGGGGRKPQNAMSRNYESSGPDVKIRGTAMHIAEKYSSLARDAMSSGDTVAAENYLQHAEHYNRIIMAAQAQNVGLPGFEGQPGINGNRFGQPDGFQRDYDGDDDGEGEGDDFIPRQRSFPERSERVFTERPERPERVERVERAERVERVAYNQNQPQPYIPQNAFPQIQPQPQPVAPPPAPNGAAPVSAEAFSAQPEADRMPRRRRRRPIGEAPPPKPFGARSANGASQDAAAGNGSLPEGAPPAPKPDEPAS